jgi:hypothetical protein
VGRRGVDRDRQVWPEVLRRNLRAARPISSCTVKAASSSSERAPDNSMSGIPVVIAFSMSRPPRRKFGKLASPRPPSARSRSCQELLDRALESSLNR